MSTSDYQHFRDPKNASVQFRNLVKRLNGDWVELHCPSCGGNARLVEGSAQVIRGVKGIKAHAEDVCGLDFNGMTLDEIAERCTLRVRASSGHRIPASPAPIVKKLVRVGNPLCEHQTSADLISLGNRHTLRPGDLTTTGVLYEGNWTKWRASIGKALSRKGINLNGILNSQVTDRMEKRLGKYTALMMRHFVSPVLISKMSKSARSNAKELFSELQKFAQPFDLLGLPPEARKIIYQLVLPKNVSIRSTVDKILQQTPVPNIVMASKILRQESLETFISEAHFHLDFETIAIDTDKHARLIKRWAENSYVHAPQSKHLRRVTLTRNGVLKKSGKQRWSLWSFEFQYSSELELTAHAHAPVLASLADDGLKKHLRYIKQRMRSKGLSSNGEQGDAIVLALTIVPGQWDSEDLLGTPLAIEDGDEEKC